ncbi:MAG: DNA mismatch repair endonuclease MutL [Acholeplasmatales bacterium]|nr:DNA mismatch repair endonuclease MutL [Acholeplasmatales bacterium]
MSKIVQLDEHLANMIAAGEVVEKPSSVVKELVENSIDAGATSITINLLESGTKLIEIIDNGCGMSKEDAKMCFSRHATSKIKSQYDLFRIGTLGFRGEAIPSIASVSKFSLYTCDGIDSTNINYNAGKLISIEPCAMNKGTKIDVENLFFNVPARLKYLKSLKSELASISYLISKFILANPALSFKLTNDNKVIYQTNGTNDIIEVFGEIYGLNVARNLVTNSFKSMGYDVELVCAKNMISRSNKLDITTIVNGRFVKSNVINDAVCRAYKTLIPEGRYPICLIRVNIDPLLIDVNVHPSKMTIKIANEQEMGSLIEQHIKESIVVENLIPDAVDTEGYKKPVLLDANNCVNEELFKDDVSSNANEIKNVLEQEVGIRDYTYRDTKALFSNTILEEEATEFKLSSLPKEIKKEDNIPSSMKYNNERIPALNYVGQIHGTYLLFESKDGMYIMDQHAAAERINYEYYYNILANPSGERTSLLVPVNVDLTQEEMIKISDMMDQFASLGIILTQSGESSYFIREIPVWLKLDDASNLIHSMISDFVENFKENIIKYRDNISKQIACKKSIKANHVISAIEVEKLVENLRKCNNPFTCPHGRPTIIRYSKSDLEKMFMRTM